MTHKTPSVEEMIEHEIEHLAAFLAYRAGLGASEYKTFLDDSRCINLCKSLTRLAKKAREEEREKIRQIANKGFQMKFCSHHWNELMQALTH